MSRTIWKFPLSNAGVNSIPLPERASVRLVDLDPMTGIPTIWVELDDSDPKRVRRFLVHGTGHRIEPDEVHVGSVIQGSFVWHVFEQAWV